MPIDARIPLSVSPGPNLPAIYQAAQQVQEGQKRNQLLDLRMQYAQEDRPLQLEQQEREREQRENAEQANLARRLIQSGDVESAIGVLRKDGPDDVLGASLASALERGESDAVSAVLDDVAGVFQSGGENIPASIREFMFREQLPDDKRAAFDRLKRAAQIVKIGGVPHVVGADNEAYPLNTQEGMASLEKEVYAAREIAKGKEQGTQQAQIDAAVPKAAAEAEADRQAGAPEAVAGALSQIQRVDGTIEEVTDAMGLVSPYTAGWGQLLSKVPGSDANTLRTKIDTIKANLAFKELQTMRDLSKTGGALGQVSERELRLLESATTSLDQSLEDDVLRDNFSKVLRHYSNAKYVLEKIVAVNRGEISQEQAMRDVEQITINSRQPQAVGRFMIEEVD